MTTTGSSPGDIGREILEGIGEMKLHREGRITLRTHTVAKQATPEPGEAHQQAESVLPSKSKTRG